MRVQVVSPRYGILVANVFTVVDFRHSATPRERQKRADLGFMVGGC